MAKFNKMEDIQLNKIIINQEVDLLFKTMSLVSNFTNWILPYTPDELEKIEKVNNYYYKCLESFYQTDYFHHSFTTYVDANDEALRINFSYFFNKGHVLLIARTLNWKNEEMVCCYFTNDINEEISYDVDGFVYINTKSSYNKDIKVSVISLLLAFTETAYNEIMDSPRHYIINQYNDSTTKDITQKVFDYLFKEE